MRKKTSASNFLRPRYLLASAKPKADETKDLKLGRAIEIHVGYVVHAAGEPKCESPVWVAPDTPAIRFGCWKKRGLILLEGFNRRGSSKFRKTLSCLQVATQIVPLKLSGQTWI